MNKAVKHFIDLIRKGDRGYGFSTRIAWLIRHFRKEWQLYLFLAPVIIWFLLFLYKPMYGLQIAFKDFSLFRGVDASPWVGFEHFRTLFDSETFMRAIKNTFVISFLNLAIAFPMPILLALMFNEIIEGKFKKTVQTIVYLPHFISLVIIAGIVINAFSPSTGVVNLILVKFGIETIYFLTQPEWFRPIFIGSGIWQEAGFQSSFNIIGANNDYKITTTSHRCGGHAGFLQSTIVGSRRRLQDCGQTPYHGHSHSFRE